MQVEYTAIYPSSHNHGSGKWPPWRLKSSSRPPFSTSMIMGERVVSNFSDSAHSEKTKNNEDDAILPPVPKDYEDRGITMTRKDGTLHYTCKLCLGSCEFLGAWVPFSKKKVVWRRRSASCCMNCYCSFFFGGGGHHP